MHLNHLGEALPQVISSSLNQCFLDLEVDLVVLSRQVLELGKFSSRIAASSRGLRLLLQEQDLIQDPRDLI